MKKQIIAVTLFAAAVVLTACKKDEVGTPVNSFNAFSEASGSAKTHLEPDVTNHAFRVMWDQGDEIKIYGAAGSSATYSTQQNDVEAATFTTAAGTGVSEGSSYTAFYPATIATSSSTVTLPAQQPYQAVQQDAGGYYGYVTGFPMAAQSSNADLYFKNLCGLCVLRLKGPSGATVSSITLSEPTYPYTTSSALSGGYSVSWSDAGLPSLAAQSISNPSTGGQESVQLSGCNVTLDGNYGLFYFYLPQGEHQWLNVKVDYTLSGTAKTFSRTILASSYDSVTTFGFTRSRWTALDVDLSSDMANTSGSESYGLVYAADSLTFSGDGDPILNTNHRITDKQGCYTILIDADPTVFDATDLTGSRFYTLYNDMDGTTPWDGIVIRYAKVDAHEALTINAEGPQYGNSTTAANANKLSLWAGVSRSDFDAEAYVRNRIAVIIGTSDTAGVTDGSSASTVYYHLFANSLNNNAWTTPAHVSAQMSWDKWKTNDATGYVRAVVGGDQSDVDGTATSTTKINFQGTIYKIRIYNRVITEAERSNWFTYGSIAGSSK